MHQLLALTLAFLCGCGLSHTQINQLHTEARESNGAGFSEARNEVRQRYGLQVSPQPELTLGSQGAVPPNLRRYGLEDLISRQPERFFVSEIPDDRFPHGQTIVSAPELGLEESETITRFTIENVERLALVVPSCNQGDGCGDCDEPTFHEIAIDEQGSVFVLRYRPSEHREQVNPRESETCAGSGCGTPAPPAPPYIHWLPAMPTQVVDVPFDVRVISVDCEQVDWPPIP